MLETAQAFIGARHDLFIGGRWEASNSGQWIDVIDPATGRQIATVPAADARDVDLAVQAALDALARTSRAGWKPADRTRAMWALSDAIAANAEEFAIIETLDAGKPITNARTVDVPGAVAALRYFAGWAGKISGETLTPSIPGDWQAFTVREPVGVVAQIIPWNYPLMGAVTKMAPALAAGCAIVLKPAEQTPLSALRLAGLLDDCGFPPGIVNVVTGHGPEAGAALVAHPDVAKISFTGSTSTGRQIVRASASSMKRLVMELGGKSPVVVLPDADLDAAAKAIAHGIFFNSGQTCSAGSRLLAHRRIVAELTERIVTIARGLRLGPGLDPSTQLGPLVSQAHLERVSGFIEQARIDGATLATGGQRKPGAGYFIEPTVLTDVHPDMPAVRQEIFGPVLCVASFDTEDLDEIAALANATEYGLSAYVWTSCLASAHGLIRRIRAGMVKVNAGAGGDFGMPVGGFKQSGFGRENGRIGVEAYTEVKSVMVAY
ncbi:MAG: betaine-aldehyde dehydrogenase [Proteobacteria bacterium]|nr:MAG: betaine-aldehyde dehydrogenase [Pseudomonadota bacterium]